MKPDKEKYYEEATRKLLATIEKMKMDKMPRIRAKNLVQYFRDSFKMQDVKYQTFWTDLGDEDMKRFNYDSDGFCRAASIDFALMMGGEPDWKLMYIDKLWTYGPHHYLLHEPTKTVLDLTYDQYTNVGMDVPYWLGKPIKMNFEEQSIEGRFAKALQLSPLLGNQKD
jgi:hypothetical protein